MFTRVRLDSPIKTLLDSHRGKKVVGSNLSSSCQDNAKLCRAYIFKIPSVS